MRRWQAILLSLIVPPIGVLLALFRPFLAQAGLFSKLVRVAGRLALAGALAILSIIYLVKLGLLFVEPSGAGIIPIFSLHDPKKDEEALEQHRANMQASAPAITPASDAAPAALAATSPSSGTASPRVEKNAGPTAAPAPAPQPPWADFRGVNRDGVYREGPVLTEWPAEGLKPLWKQPIGGGYASFTIAQGRAFTIEQRRDKEVVAAYDVPTGRELWTYGWPARFSEMMGGDGPRATPVWHDGLLYALGATGEFQVLEAATGKLAWSMNILSDNAAQNIMWGMANSPLIVDEKVIVTPGGRSNGKSVVAYHKKTGDRIWGALDDQAAYTSPMLVTLAGVRQILVVTAKRIVGLKPEDGALLWEYPWVTMYDINSAQPIVAGANQVLVSAGYDHGSVLLEIAPKDGALAARPVWENKNLKNRFNSSVLYAGHIYGYDEGIFACIDARTGQRMWKGGRYGYGQAILAGDHIVVLTESGELVLIKAAPDALHEITRSPAIEGKTWNHPAIAGGILLVRNAREMAAFRIAP